MNRMTPLITRRVGPYAASLNYGEFASDQSGSTSDYENLKLFATGWIGGLVFFGTLFG